MDESSLYVDSVDATLFQLPQNVRPRIELQEEVARIEKMLAEIDQQLEDGGIDFASSVRLNIHRSEVLAYRNGISYAACGSPEFESPEPVTF